MILAESLLLIMLDDESGSTYTNGSDEALVGALLLDLVRGGHLTLEGKELAATISLPGHPTLRIAYDYIASQDKPRKVSWLMTYMPWKVKPLMEIVAGPLVQQGVLEEQRSKWLGMFNTVKFPEADPEPERQMRAGLADALTGAREPTEDEALLLSLLVPLYLVRPLVPKEQRREAVKRAEAYAERTPVSAAVKDAVEEIQFSTNLAVQTAVTTAST